MVTAKIFSLRARTFGTKLVCRRSLPAEVAIAPEISLARRHRAPASHRSAKFAMMRV